MRGLADLVLRGWRLAASCRRQLLHRRRADSSDDKATQLNIIGLEKAYPEFEFTSLRHLVSSA